MSNGHAAAVRAEPVVVTPVAPDDAAALAALFEREGSPCFCRYWHFAGTNKEWEARCALAPEDNRAELTTGLARSSDDTRGWVARFQRAHDRIVGWMKLTPRRALPKLLARVPYRSVAARLDDGLDDGTIFSIACFLVDGAHRRRGVARALLETAIAQAPRWGAKAIEAYPRVAEGLHDGEMWTGPLFLFQSLGFEAVFDSAQSPQYPVLRRVLR